MATMAPMATMVNEGLMAVDAEVLTVVAVTFVTATVVHDLLCMIVMLRKDQLRTINCVLE
jgi:hypothetical protein